jgi:O-antigen/teichoic acid export membrane protein
LVDQGFSSATNFALTLVAARLLGPSGLGVVFVGFTIYLLVLSFQRALITDPLVVVSTNLGPEDRRSAARASLTIVLGLGLLSGVAMAALAPIMPQPVGRGLALFAPWMVLALIQDLWRTLLFRDGRGAAASLNDGVWLVVMALAVPFAWLTHSDYVVVATWGVGAAAGGVLGFFQTRIPPIERGYAWRWWRREASRLGRWLGLENIVIGVQSQAVVLILATLLGDRDIGGLRAVESVFAPMTLIGAAIGMAGLPLLSRSVAESFTVARQRAVRLSSLMAAVVFMYLLVAGLVRGQVLSTFFGPSFRQFSGLVLPLAVGQLIFAWGSGFWLLAKASSRGQSLLIARAVSAGCSLLLATGLGIAFGITGAAWGLAIGTGVGSILITLFCTRDSAVHDRQVVPGPLATQSPGSSGRAQRDRPLSASVT